MAEIETPALSAWYERADQRGGIGAVDDHPEITVRYMRRAPSVTLTTHAKPPGPGAAVLSWDDFLPDPEHPFAVLVLGGVMFHAPLADLEWYVDAARDALRVLRAMAVGLGREADRRTHCRHGHPWIPENITTFGDGRRTCSTCWAATRERNR